MFSIRSTWGCPIPHCPRRSKPPRQALTLPLRRRVRVGSALIVQPGASQRLVFYREGLNQGDCGKAGPGPAGVSRPGCPPRRSWPWAWFLAGPWGPGQGERLSSPARRKIRRSYALEKKSTREKPKNKKIQRFPGKAGARRSWQGGGYPHHFGFAAR